MAMISTQHLLQYYLFFNDLNFYAPCFTIVIYYEQILRHINYNDPNCNDPNIMK